MLTNRQILRMLVLFVDNPAAAGTGGGGAAAAPAAPAAPTLPATEAASQAAREAIAAGKSLADIAEGGSHHSARQPRDTEGHFDGAPAPAGPRDGEPPVLTGVAPQGDVKPGEAGAQPPADPGTAQPGEQGADPNAPPAGEEGGQGGIELPPLATGEEPIALEIEDEAAAKRLQALVERSAQLDQYISREQEFTRQADEIENIQAAMEIDPAGYLLNVLPKEKPVVLNLLRFLLTQEEVWTEIAPTIQEWQQDPTKLREARADAKEERVTMRDTLAQERQERAAVKANFSQIQSTIASYMPENMTEDQRRLFFADALRDVQHHAQRMNLMTVPVADLPTILAPRMRGYGIDPVAAAARGAARPASVKAAAAAPAGNGKPAAAATAQPTGQQLAQGSAAKKAFSRVPGNSAGSPSSVIEAPPAGLSIKETTEWHRNRLKAGQGVLPR